MAIIIPANTLAAGGFDVDNSCRFDGSSSYMQKTLGAPTSAKKATFSLWFKTSDTKASNGGRCLMSWGDDAGAIYVNETNDGQWEINLDNSDGLYKGTAGGQFSKDPTAWSHLCLIIDTTNGTANDRFQFFLNNVRVVLTANTNNNPDQNYDVAGLADGQVIAVGRRHSTTSLYYSGYMAEVCFIDGNNLAATNFGEVDEDSGIFKPIDVSGLTFGNNGFYLDFEASDNLGNDANGGTDLTESGLAATDQSTDTCTNNFATFNPLTTIDASLIKEGNLFPELATADESVVSTIAMTSGKWYWEAKVTDQGSRGYHGITSYTVPQIGGNAPRTSGFSFAVAFGHDGTTGAGVGTVNSNFKGSAIANDEILTFCFDADNGQIWIDINAVDISGTATVTGLTTGIPYFAFFEESGSNADRTDVKYNFGSPIVALSSANADGEGFGSFEYAPPSGYFALCTKNLAEYG
jgi:hypothetical protein